MSASSTSATRANLRRAPGTRWRRAPPTTASGSCRSLDQKGPSVSFSVMETIDFGKDAANPSGAPEAGGATSHGSVFGGDSLTARLLRMVARVARDIEAHCY